MRSHYTRFLSILLFTSGAEGILAVILTLSIPGEADSALMAGLSPARLALVLPVVILAFAAIYMAFSSNRHPGLAERLLDPVSAPVKPAAVLLLISFLFLLLPPYELAVTFKAYHARLFYIILWLGLTAIQFLALVFWIFISRTGWRNCLESFPARNRTALFWGLSVLFPIVLMSPRLWVFNGHQFGVGNDFVPFSYFYKVYLLDFLANLQIPLWSPSEAAGFPYLASPHTQTLYPLNIPLAVFYWWKGSYGLLDHAWFTVLGMSIFSAGMFAWLKQFKWRESSALLAAIIISVGFRITELIRFPWAVHTIAWLPWFLYFLTRFMKYPREKLPVKVYLGLGFSVFCFITGGYLYYQYYSIFLLVPYFLILSINQARRQIGFETWNFSPAPLLRLVLAILVPVIILSPYLMNVLLLLGQVETRGQVVSASEIPNYLSFNDLIGALVFPPVTSPETWFYIGFLPLILILQYFFTSPMGFKREGTSRDADFWYLSPAVKIGLAVFLLFVLSFMLGGDSPLFVWLWEHFPFFSFIKNWGRINILLIPILGFALAAGFETMHHQLRALAGPENSGPARRLFIRLMAIWTLLMGLLIYARGLPLYPQWGISFYLLTPRLDWFFAALAITGLLILIVFLLAVKRKLSGLLERMLPVFMMVVILADLMPVGSMQWPLEIIPEVNPPGRLKIRDNVIPDSFLFPRTIGKTNISITPVFSYGTFPTWYFRSYTSFFDNHQFERSHLDDFMGAGKSAQKVYLSRSINHDTIADFLDDASSFPGAFLTDEYNGEVLVVEVEVDATEPGYLSFIDNWDPYWTVTVNGEAQELVLLFDTFKSVRVPAGESVVRFEYQMRLFPIEQLAR